MKALSELHSRPEDFAKYLNLLNDADVNHILKDSLWNPLEDFFKNPGKNIRPKLVDLGFRLAFASEDEIQMDEYRERLQRAQDIVEAIHAGALIVDDIQDGSEIRRNLPTLHLQHGMPKALNAGNWLYFWGLEQIQHLGLSPEQRLKLNDSCLRYISRAHMGQAIDLGTCMSELNRSQVKEVCLASMELKTGTLLSLALTMGAAVSGKDYDEELLDTLGIKLGIILQTFDDIGNFFQEKNAQNIKRWEDLRLRRPTWIWAQAASLSEDSYGQFIQAVHQLPEEEHMNQWAQQNNFKELVMIEAQELLYEFIQFCDQKWTVTHQESSQMLIGLGKYLEKAYV